MKTPKKWRKVFIVGMMASVLMGALCLTGCETTMEILAAMAGADYSGSYSSSACPNGSCHVFADSDGDGSYDVCTRPSCSAGNVPYPVPPNTSAYCDC